MLSPKNVFAINPATGGLDLVPVIPSWANTPEKPEYDADEVFAVTYVRTQQLTESQQLYARENINASKNWAQEIVTGSTLTLADQTEFNWYGEDELTIEYPMTWMVASKAVIYFSTGDTAPTIQLPSNMAFSGSVNANSYVEISIRNQAAIIVSIPKNE